MHLFLCGEAAPLVQAQAPVADGQMYTSATENSTPAPPVSTPFKYIDHTARDMSHIRPFFSRNRVPAWRMREDSRRQSGGREEFGGGDPATETAGSSTATFCTASNIAVRLSCTRKAI